MGSEFTKFKETHHQGQENPWNPNKWPHSNYAESVAQLSCTNCQQTLSAANLQSDNYGA